MRCSRCQHDNPEQSRFCSDCGARLSQECANCGAELMAGAKFCNRCGDPIAQRGEGRFPSPVSYTPRHLAEKILTSRAALEGERKQVTVLFADLKGSMELLADRDPEEARKLLDPVLERMMDAVHRYEGTVNQVMGDGIMALFGAPLAHEDHAVRACYAALRMQETVSQYADEVQRSRGVPVTIRVGVNSGEVVVRAIGSDLHMDYTAVGQTSHLAARMEQMARPGTTLLTADTLRLAEGYVEVKALGPAAVKGLDAPQEIFELQGVGRARSRLHVAAVRGLTRFVGRAAELEQLEAALERARGGAGEVVAIVGELGVGKSRLCWEVMHSGRTKDWLILEAGSIPYNTTRPYLPVIELLRTYFRVDRLDDVHRIREQVTGKLATLDDTLMEALPVFLSLLDVPGDDHRWRALDPSQRRQSTMDACARLLVRESELQPVCVVFEDLHWVDSESRAVLDQVVERLPTARMLLLVSYRPDYKSAWDSLSYGSELKIDPLPPATADELLTALLGNSPDLQPVKRVLISRSDGNPFFLEESVRSLVETGAVAKRDGAYRLVKDRPAIRVPATVQAVLAARVDRLPSEEKSVLQVAAVIGNSFTFTLLHEVTAEYRGALERVLAHLTDSEFLYQTSLFPDLEYRFKHALTHEVVYETLLHEQQRSLHVQILDALERLHADRLTEHVESLAHHACRGGVWDKAVTYLREAGRKAASRSALHDARTWLEAALGAVGRMPESPSMLQHAFEIRLELRPVLNLLGEVPHALQRLREAEAIAQRLNDDRGQGRVCAFVTNVYSLIGELDEALASGARALAIAAALGDHELRIITTTYLEHAHYLRGEYDRVVELATGNLAALPAARIGEYFGGTSPPSVYDRLWLIMSLAQLGRFTDANEHASEAIRLAARTNHAFTLGVAYRAASTLEFLKGDWAKARSLTEQWISVARTGNVVLQLTRAITSSAWILSHFGETNEALARLQEGEQLLERHAARGLMHNLGWDYYSLGRAYLLLGRLDEARTRAERALEVSPRHPGFAAHARQLLGDVAIHPDRVDRKRGEEHYRHALNLAEPRAMRPLVALCHLGLGRLSRCADSLSEAREHLGVAIGMCRVMGMHFWLQRATDELDELR